jgi:hypothetical protein
MRVSSQMRGKLISRLRASPYMCTWQCSAALHVLGTPPFKPRTSITGLGTRTKMAKAHAREYKLFFLYVDACMLVSIEANTY